MKTLVAVLCSLFLAPFLVHAQIELGEYPMAEFSPSRGQQFAIPFRLTAPAEVAIRINTSDGNLIRTLKSESLLGPGTHSLRWDGRDEAGAVVPDEAYLPVLVARNANGEEIFDPRKDSGGEEESKLPVEVSGLQEIAYTLPVPCRVLIRVGIKGGPMLRSLAYWEPRTAGRNIQHWDGLDQSGIIDLRPEKNLSFLVTAFRLPHGSILTVGNTKETYLDYYQRKKWSEREIRPEEMVLSRDGVRISRHYYSSQSLNPVPKVTLEFADPLPRSEKTGLPIVRPGQSVPVRVNIAREELWLMNESLYEVAFFIDHNFVSEEEQGYVPLTWLWSVNGLSPGRHLLTTNISGFSGKVGIANLFFEVSD